MTSPALMRRSVPVDSLPWFINQEPADEGIEFLDDVEFPQIRDALLAATLKELEEEFARDIRWSRSTMYAARQYVTALILDEDMDRQSRYLENEQRDVLKKLFAKMMWSFRGLFLTGEDNNEFILIPGTRDRWFGQYYQKAGHNYPNLYARYEAP